ncbi:uncharacterized protein [Rutidosis leptorrhynchoides]|uniref:uncharacterized protein n=1 Tax=Rutidosis leptorrhynchoides TaxID=125765 RepID=UPI003A99405E
MKSSFSEYAQYVHSWDSFRPRGSVVTWYSVVWFSHGILKHAFMLWLVMGERLKTQDKLKPWDIRDGSTPICAFCKSEPDSHTHLFFLCPFSMQVWGRVQSMIITDVQSFDIRVVVERITPMASRRLARVVVSKLCLAATVYGLWQETNLRIFKKISRTDKQVFDAIMSDVRLKLATTKFKCSSNVDRIKRLWQLDKM